MPSTPPSGSSQRSVESTEQGRAAVATPLSHQHRFGYQRDVHHQSPSNFSAAPATSPSTSFGIELNSLVLSSPASSSSRPVPHTLPTLSHFNGYYHGLPARPQLIARSDPSIWAHPTSPIDSGFADTKTILPVDPAHPICKIWDTALGSKLLEIIDSHTDFANSVDIARICFDSEKDTAGPIIWIGIQPGKMSIEAGQALVQDCVYLLNKESLKDVAVEVKESDIVLLSAPRLYDPPTIKPAIQPFATRLSISSGIPICTSAGNFYRGTGSFLLGEVGHPQDIFLSTAAHVVNRTNNVNGWNSSLPLPKHRRPRGDHVCIPDRTITNLLEETEERISDLGLEIEGKKVEMKFKDKDGKKLARILLRKTQDELAEVQAFRSRLASGWQENKVIGKLYIFPKIAFAVEPGSWTEDWALIKLDSQRISHSVQNWLDLSLQTDFIAARKSPLDIQPRLGILQAGLLRLKGVISQTEMEQPIAVLMRGASSGLKTGYSMPVASMIKNNSNTDGLTSKPYREDDSVLNDGDKRSWSREWCITAYPDEPPFSVKGDSGGGVVARDGRIGGVMTGGCKGAWGANPTGVDMTYVTPMFFILERMKLQGLVPTLL
ncbi:uncharacterized protein IL334_007464 [Kwoniella shivajii]|uniref:Peptidase S1 domain-containing protein n=1 Tax=Kwoniella shivajii TaxID=564305 RepID=A0ABZ1D8R1_9TREE|nr:hypothetical protein IL334_007464 [Kwoniella shivajii]